MIYPDLNEVAKLADTLDQPSAVSGPTAHNAARALRRLQKEVQELRTARNSSEPDMRHPKIQRLIGAQARLQYELSLVEQLISEGSHAEMCPTDMEYWNNTHDALQTHLRNSSRFDFLLNQATWTLDKRTDKVKLSFHFECPDVGPLDVEQVIDAGIKHQVSLPNG